MANVNNAQALRAKQAQQNADFMRYSYRQPIKADPQNGNSYTVGSSGINYDVPIQTGGWAEKLTIRANLSVPVTLSTGSAAVNAGAPWSAIQEVRVTFGNQQITIPGYVCKVLSQMQGYNREFPGQSLGGQQYANVQSMIYTSPAVANGSNTWKFDLDVPLNLLHPNSPIGMIPISGSGTRLQVTVIPATSFTGADPLLNPVSITGAATVGAVTGTVDCIVWFRNYRSMAVRSSLSPNLDGLPTVQIIRVPDINPLTAGVWNYKRFVNPYPFVKFVSLAIDGNSSGTFCSATNLVGYELDEAENSNSAFFRYDVTTGGMVNYYREQRHHYGQDFEEGVITFDAPSRNIPVADLQSGDAYLNLTSSGYPAARLGVNVNTVSSATITPRVSTWAILLNPEGLKLA